MGRHTRNDRPSFCLRCSSPKVVNFAASIVCSACGNVMAAAEPSPKPVPEPGTDYPDAPTH